MNWPLQTGPEKVNKTGIYQKSRWQMRRQGYEIKKKKSALGKNYLFSLWEKIIPLLFLEEQSDMIRSVF